MDDVLNTLFLPLNQDVISSQNLGGKVAFLNAGYTPDLKDIKADLHVQQYFKPYAEILQDKGLKVYALDFPSMETQDTVFLLLPKNMTEAQDLLKAAQCILKTGGLIIAAADNKAGGSRIKKMLEDLGFEIAGHLSKNKARVVWANKQANTELVFPAAKPLEIQGEKFWSWPGIFGWDKIDRGSQILLRHLPELKGTGADFGCGYGYLSRHVLEKNSAIKSLYCIDADARSVECCKKNCEQFSAAKYSWADLTKGIGIKNLDFIIMNPPFHEGKKTDIQTGIDFIKIAQNTLRKGGALWMVANAHLPYEETLKKIFSSVEKKYEGEGFKIYCCIN